VAACGRAGALSRRLIDWIPSKPSDLQGGGPSLRAGAPTAMAPSPPPTLAAHLQARRSRGISIVKAYQGNQNRRV
jgi:hypothetical protein